MDCCPMTEFQIVCIKCDSLGILMDCSELAPSSTIVKCSHCLAARGTLGELRRLALTDRHDMFDMNPGLNA